MDEARSENWLLQPRMYETATLLSEGNSNEEISRRMCISKKTVENYIAKIYETFAFGDDGAISTRVKVARWIWEHPGETNVGA